MPAPTTGAGAARTTPPQTWSRVREHFGDDEIVALVSLVALINATNRLSVILDFAGGSCEPGLFAGMEA